MARIVERAVVAAPPEAVYAYRLDFASNLAAYNPNVASVEQIGGDGPGVGARYRVKVRMAPGYSATALLTVTEAVPPLLVCDRADSFISADETVRFEPTQSPAGDSATQVLFEVVTNPRSLLLRVLDRALVGLSRRQVRTELRLIRAHLEGRG